MVGLIILYASTWMTMYIHTANELVNRQDSERHIRNRYILAKAIKELETTLQKECNHIFNDALTNLI